MKRLVVQRPKYSYFMDVKLLFCGREVPRMLLHYCHRLLARAAYPLEGLHRASPAFILMNYCLRRAPPAFISINYTVILGYQSNKHEYPYLSS